MKHGYYYFISLGLILTGVHENAFSQSAIIRGSVLDKQSGEPVIYTNVILKGSTLGAQTNDDGFYVISNVPAGSYQIFCTQLGYDTTIENVTVKANEILNQKIFLQKRAIELSNVSVNANKEAERTETQVSLTKVTAADINRIPSIGGEADLAQYLQVLPGVIFTGDQGGELYIRGGSPIQNKVLLDGLTIYNPFHSIGLFSVFETDIIRDVSVFTGGFSAEYGDRLSAVLDINTRDGNKKEFAGKIGINPFASKLILEGPIKKLDENGASISYLVTGKTAYLDQTSKIFYNYIDSGLPYRFTDLYGKLSFNSAGGSKLALFGFNYTDHANYQSISDFGWKSSGFGADFTVVPAGSKAVIDGDLNYSNYKITLQEADQHPRTSGVNGFDLTTTFSYFQPHGEFKYGFDIGGFRTTLDFFNTLGLEIQQDQNTTELSGFVNFRHVFGDKLVIEPGLRLQYYASLPAFSPEPRISAKYNLSKSIRLKGSVGIYSQNLISTKSDLDIVNLFTGYLTAPEGQLNGIDGQPVNSNLQKAWQAVLGVEADPSENITLTLEPYYKFFGELISLNHSKLFPTDPDFQVEQGKAYGIDFTFKYVYKNYYLWLAYSYGNVTRNDGQQVYPPNFDRRHNLNIVASYNWGKNQSWEFDVRFNLGTGFPFTLTQGFYNQLNFLNGINTNYLSQNGLLGIVYDDSLNTGRLPIYHRVDIALKKEIVFTRSTKLDIDFSVINVYNRQNVFYFDRIRYQRVNQLPILPAIGLTLSF